MYVLTSQTVRCCEEHGRSEQTGAGMSKQQRRKLTIRVTTKPKKWIAITPEYKPAMVKTAVLRPGTSSFGEKKLVSESALNVKLKDCVRALEAY